MMVPGKDELLVAITSQDIQQAIKVLDGGGIVAFPTETYYGLAVDPFNKAALSRLFALKRRAPDKPVLVLISDPGQLTDLVVEIPNQYQLLMNKLWPGPLTLVFEGLATIPEMLTGYSGTIGIRISSHPVAQRLSTAIGRPITATSANFSGQPAAVNAAGVTRQLGPDVDFILDGGETPGGNGSTIIGLEDEQVALIRSGVIPYENILDIIAP